MSDLKKEKEDIELVADEEGGAPELQKKMKKLKGDLKACEEEKREYLSGWQRAKADYINYKNDEGKRLEDTARFMIAGFIQDIVPVLDSFDLALGHGMQPGEERGVLLIRSQFEDILKKRGLTEIPVAPGEHFNPERHESIGEVASEHPEGTVAEVVQKGYMFRERVLRPARVRLSTKHT